MQQRLRVAVGTLWWVSTFTLSKTPGPGIVSLQSSFELPQPFGKPVPESLMHYSLKLCVILPLPDIDTEHALEEMQVLLGQETRLPNFWLVGAAQSLHLLAQEIGNSGDVHGNPDV